MSDVYGGIDYAKIKAKLEEVWQSGGAGREALYGKYDVPDGISEATAIKVRPDVFSPTHFYWIYDRIQKGLLPSDYWPDWWIKPYIDGVTPGTYRYEDGGVYIYGRTFERVTMMYGRLRIFLKLIDVYPVKNGFNNRFGLASYGFAMLEVYPGIFHLRSQITHEPSETGVVIRDTDLTWHDDYLDTVHRYIFDWYPGLIVFQIDYENFVWQPWNMRQPCYPVIDARAGEVWVQAVDVKWFTDIRKFQPPPLPLWQNETVPATGKSTREVPGQFYSAKTFYLLSDQDGAVDIQVDLGDGVWRTLVDDEPVTANALWSYQTTYDAKFMRLFFDPVAEATVSSWAVLRI
ncbi:MAG: hypothetical protein DRP08_05360 [Candidatus Aenigmatarchaeota archaeon]|nr:MAG: hypothetical protein DRP08_05360 [Candidatus Aenigmarchaeota archaeon]